MKTLQTFFILTFLSVFTFAQTTFDVRFNVATNDGTNFNIDVEMKGNNLPAVKTLNSVTFDILYDNTKLPTYSGPSEWGFLFVPDGYGVTTADDLGGGKIRITILGSNVKPGQFPGKDVSETFTRVVRLNFTHGNPLETATFTIDPTTAQISLFDVQSNNDNSGTNTEYNPPQVNLIPLTNQPLPVELSSFSVNSVEGTKAQLQWETATEVNNYGFEIERSLAVNEDGQSKTEPNWEKVTFIEGHGNSNSTKTYSFTDKNLVGGSKFIYRLKQIDIDGTFEYSDAVEIEVLPNKYELLQNYPNPFNPETNIKFSLPEDAKIAINIYNVLGERVATILNKDLKAGFHQVNFNTTSAGYRLSSGVYIYTLESKSFSQVKKMILMK